MFNKYDAYKDSHIQGIELIPEKWKVLKLKYLIDSKAGFAFPSEAFSDTGTAVVRISDLLASGIVDVSKSPKLPSKFNKYLSEYFAKEGDILMAMTGGTIGKVSIYKHEQKSFLNQRVCKFIPKANFYPKLAWYWMNTDVWKDYIDLKAFGGAQPNISDNTIKEMQICLPDSLDTQISICNFLDEKTYEIEQVIAIKEQQIALLNERKQIVIQKAVTQGLNPNVVMKDSGVEWIGQTPQHWIVKKLKYVLKERSERSKDGLEPLLMMSQVHGLVVRSEYSEKTEVAATTVGNKLVYKNDLVFNKLKAHLGVFFSSVHDFAGCVSPDYAVYDCVNYIENTKFLELLFRNPLYIKQFILRSSGIVEGLIRLYTTELFDLKIGIPPKDEQMAILKHIEEQSFRFDEAVKNYSEQIEKLKEYKTTLINDAVTGKIKVA